VGTQRYLLRKVVHLLITLFFVLTFAFLLFRVLMPGDPVTTFVRSSGAHLNAEQIEILRHEYGFDQPILLQYVDYLRDMATLNMGNSTFLYPGQPVMPLFWHAMGKSLVLIVLSTIASIIIGIVLGVYSGWRRGGSIDNASMGGSLLLYAMPEFVLGMIFLLTFSSYFHLFPSSGYDSFPVHTYTGFQHFLDVGRHMALPWLTLTLAYMGEFYLVMRSSLLDVLGEEYITLARAKGVREKVVRREHAVRNALLPTVTLIALSFGFILGGIITVEIVFSYPGVGFMSLNAATSQDFPILQVTFLFSVLGVLIANLIADLLYGYLDPRVRTA
jgi:peptide/nickel transport system permease protein